MCNGVFHVVKYGPGANISAVHEISCWQPPVKEGIVNEVPAFTQHRIGDLQMLAVNDFKTYLTSYRNYQLLDGDANINIDSPKFDGFVIPNGHTFTCAASKFKSACLKYSSSKSATATSFTVPDLRDTFFKCDPGLPTAQMTPLSHIDSACTLPQHKHTGSLISNKRDFRFSLTNVQFEGRTTHTNNPQYLNSMHGGSKNSASRNVPSSYENDVGPKLMSIDLTCDANGMTCSYAGEDEEIWP